MSAPLEARSNRSGSEGENPTPVISMLEDVLPIPANTEPDKFEIANKMADEPSLSHALAAADDHEEKGAVQKGTEYRTEVADLGWNEKKEGIVAPLVGGLNNEDLWLLVRRFNKQVYHVKEVPHPVPGNLDLNIADEEEFSPDKLRANVERLYMTIIISMLNAVKHIARLRSWKEARRTSYFCAAYFIAWLFDFLLPLFIATLITLVVYPRSRAVLFPPAPIALVDSDSGGVQKPKAGVLGSHDSATGAPENHKGEAVEQEASNFFNGFTSVVITSATGKHPQAEPFPEGASGVADKLPDPTGMTVGAAEAKDLASGGEKSPTKDKTKVPIENTIWLKMRPIMHGIADVADTWERLANALSPTPPFPQDAYRLRLATLIIPILLISLFTTSYLFTKGATFGFGFAFFGDPITTRSLLFLNSRFPHWQKILELRNTVLKGVPTNAQLTLTLLRIGEANKAPLPPPPRVRDAPPDEPADLVPGEHLGTAGGDEKPLGADEDELRRAAEYDPSAVPHLTDDADADAAKTSKHVATKRGGKILGLFKGAAKGAVKTVIGADHARAKAGSDRARDRLGAVSAEKPASGPVEFVARYGGRKGNVCIATEATVPAVGFSPDSVVHNVMHGKESGNNSDLHPVWSIPVSDIRELKKIGGYGWKGRIVVGWSLGREINDGLEITDRRGETVRVTAVPLRDELFNRLVAMGGQKWEAW